MDKKEKKSSGAVMATAFKVTSQVHGFSVMFSNKKAESYYYGVNG